MDDVRQTGLYNIIESRNPRRCISYRASSRVPLLIVRSFLYTHDHRAGRSSPAFGAASKKHQQALSAGRMPKSLCRRLCSDPLFHDRAFAGCGNVALVSCQPAAGCLGWWSHVILASCIEFLVRNLSVDLRVRDVDLDDVAFLQQSDVAAGSSFRTNWSDGGSAT